MPLKPGTPAYQRRREKENRQRREQRAAARLARHGGPSVPPSDALRLEYQKDPIRWAREALGIEERTLRWSAYGGPYADRVWDGDPDPLARICTEIAAGRWVGVESAKSVGKTFLAAVLSLWFLEVFPGSTVVTVAPREAQLSKALWKEIGRLWPRFARRRPVAEKSHLKVLMDPPRLENGVQVGGESWSMFGWSAGVGATEESAARAQGLHDEYMLIIAEEAAGVKPAIMTAFKETSTRPKTNLILALGNPDNQQDPLHLFCISHGVVSVRVSALDHPNVVLDDSDLIRGAVSRGALERAEHAYGVGSLRYDIVARGISPAQAADALIRMEWIQAAAAREMPGGAMALGVDVANSDNGDFAAIARGSGARLESVVDFQCPDANRMARERVAPYLAAGMSPRRCGVDGIGVGAGSVNELKRIGYRVLDIQSGTPNPPPLHKGDVEQYLNLRAQMWWTLAQDLQHGRVGGPAFADKELQKELLVVKAGTRNGRIWVQAKEDLRKWLRRSPNRADAVVYWNWARQAGGGSRITGGGFVGSW